MIYITENATKKVQEQLLNRGSGLGIRVGVKTTGCNGYAYTLEFADEQTEYDHEFKMDTFSILIDNKSMSFLDGVTIDYVKKGLNEGFEYINPREKSRCGCGESFEI